MPLGHPAKRERCIGAGKEFSKQQLRQPPGKRTCKEHGKLSSVLQTVGDSAAVLPFKCLLQDCVDKQQNKSYLPPQKEIKKKFAGQLCAA